MKRPPAAQAAGHPDVVAPPTFPIVVAFQAMTDFMADPDVGIELRNVVHSEQRFEIDRPGKDSWRLARAGAATTVITSTEKVAVIKYNAQEIEPSVADTVARYFGDVDLVLTEGFKASSLPKIEVHRRDLGAPLLCRGEHRDPALLGVASDVPLALDVPVFPLDDVGELCNFLIERLLR